MRMIEEATVLLGEDHLARLVDGPLDQAARQFRCEDGDGSIRFLHEAVESYVRHLHEALGRPLPTSAVRDEAIALLTRLYQGAQKNGYDGAVADAIDPAGTGVSLVLHNLMEALRSHLRYTYTRWVRARYIESADWPTRCEMARIILGRCRKWLPPRLQRFPAEWFVANVYDLLTLDLATNEQLLSPANSSSE
jgi:hypothetical protein